MQNVGALITGNGTVIVGVIAAIVAIWGVVTQRIIARRRATMDALFSTEADGDLLEARKMFRNLQKEPGGLAQWADADKAGSDQAGAIYITLNQHELIAIGIQRGILDLEIYSRWNKSSVMQTWDKSAPFVLALRERLKNHEIYCEFEALAFRLSHRKRRRWSRWRGLFF